MLLSKGVVTWLSSNKNDDSNLPDDTVVLNPAQLSELGELWRGSKDVRMFS